MDLELLNDITPFIRTVRIKKSYSLSGQWLDNDNVFTYIYSGEADFILNGIKYHLREGDAFIMCPLLPHIINSSTTELVQFIFHFDLFYDKSRSFHGDKEILYPESTFIPEEKEMLFKNNFSISSLEPFEGHALVKRFLLMNKEFNERSEGYELAMKSSAIDILLLLLRSKNHQVHDRKKSKSWFAIDKALHYINENIKSNLDINEISRIVNVTPNHLSGSFKKETGVSLHQYINSVRIEKAKKLILAGELNFTQIARETGYSSIHSFCKVFKRITGMNATEYQTTGTADSINQPFL